ncbi:HAD family hydrolase [Sphingomonas japonica]|uniref:Sulfotransferase family protein n=1 Tax=Sphingomonas japonica TaxID=511662 RepID=A0ABX0U0S6_9SPHN|nr:HAD family hydrolase [Sphingomonas japonica]NIJ24150.1 hypothetical protein [Sphingomonas japonica]
MTVRIAMWSGPRNLSTALMRSFSSRADCAVSDEPFYGCFLKASGEPHPLAAETIASMDCDWRTVLATQSGDAPGDRPIWYQKHMPHHMIGPVTIADMPAHRHAFLIRAPQRFVASYRAKNELRRPELLGFAQMRRYFEREADRIGRAPPVVDSDDILADPAALLRVLCDALAIPWDPAMLRWREGPHPEDGVWGRHWYDQVNRSTGFGRPPGPLPRLEGDYAAVADACADDYAAMAAHRITAR